MLIKEDVSLRLVGACQACATFCVALLYVQAERMGAAGCSASGFQVHEPRLLRMPVTKGRQVGLKKACKLKTTAVISREERGQCTGSSGELGASGVLLPSIRSSKSNAPCTTSEHKQEATLVSDPIGPMCSIRCGERNPTALARAWAYECSSSNLIRAGQAVLFEKLESVQLQNKFITRHEPVDQLHSPRFVA